MVLNDRPSPSIKHEIFHSRCEIRYSTSFFSYLRKFLQLFSHESGEMRVTTQWKNSQSIPNLARRANRNGSIHEKWPAFTWSIMRQFVGLQTYKVVCSNGQWPVGVCVARRAQFLPRGRTGIRIIGQPPFRMHCRYDKCCRYDKSQQFVNLTRLNVALAIHHESRLW